MSNNSALQTFDFNSHALRVITDEHGEPWFIAKDVADILCYVDTQAMTRRLDDDEVKKANLQNVGLHNNQALINESGLYSSILGSNKPEAKAFKKHVTSKILPAIRKTGSYSTYQEPPAQADLFNNITIDKDHYIDLLRYKLDGLQTPCQAKTPPPSTILSRRQRRWTEEEITLLCQLYHDGVSYRAIGEQLNKTLGAIKQAIHARINSQAGAA